MFRTVGIGTLSVPLDYFETLAFKWAALSHSKHQLNHVMWAALKSEPHTSCCFLNLFTPPNNSWFYCSPSTSYSSNPSFYIIAQSTYDQTGAQMFLLDIGLYPVNIFFVL